MRSVSHFSVLALLGIASAAPALNSLAPTESLARRDVCDGVGASPILYREYRSDSCPPINTMNDDGTCPGQDWDLNKCVSYCQVRTTFTYGREVPVENSYCHGPLTCSIAETTTRTITKSLSVNPSWELGFRLGITGGFTWADATSKAQSRSIPLKSGQCGYFTIVPVWRSTCGTVTEGDLGQWPLPWCVPDKTTENVCVDEQRLNPDGTVDAETIFVYTDCSNRQPLPADQQDPVFNHPEVPLDRQSYDVLAQSWESVGEASQGIPAAPAPAPPAFTSGTCAFHLREEWKIVPMRQDAEAAITVTLVDGAQNEIGHLDRTVISNGQALDVTSALPLTVHIVPGDTGEDWEYWNYYTFGFSYGDKSWPATQADGESRCNLGGRDHPLGSEWMSQDMDCFFPC